VHYKFVIYDYEKALRSADRVMVSMGMQVIINGV